MTTPNFQAQITQFEEENGRPLRILHLGNIANYAYTNAKLQRRLGIEAHVLDPDFYHIMASPEWIDSDFEGDYGDDFQPTWHKVKLKGFKRPDWFIQGPFDLCLDYLDSFNNKRWVLQKLDRWLIDQFRKVNSKSTRVTPKERKASAEAGAKWVQVLTPKFWAVKFGKVYSRYRDKSRTNWEETFEPKSEFKGKKTLTVEVYQGQTEKFLKVFSQYDIVQGYSASGLSPLSSGHPNVVAYEIGTIRGLPFEDSEIGKSVKWLYQNAPAVAITNVDCVDAADKLKIGKKKRALALHSYDVDTAVSFSKDPLPSKLDRKKPFFFAPARHHWKKGNLSWLKGNDVLIQGAALAAKKGHDFDIYFIEWGEEVEESKKLIDQLGLTDRVHWLIPVASKKLWPIYCEACAVIDQFRAPAFGGVALDSLALGRRLITGFDEDAAKGFFETSPPIFNVRTKEAIADAIIECVKDPSDEAGKGQLGQDWFLDQHSVQRQMDIQFALYSMLLKQNGVAPHFDSGT